MPRIRTSIEQQRRVPPLSTASRRLAINFSRSSSFRVLQNLSKIELEAWENRIAVNDGWVFNSLGQLSRPLDGDAVVERIEQPSEARTVRAVLLHFRLHIGKAVCS